MYTGKQERERERERERGDKTLTDVMVKAERIVIDNPNCKNCSVRKIAKKYNINLYTYRYFPCGDRGKE
jgi:hypothetical protein